MRDAAQKLENVVINFDVQGLDASDCDYADISPIGDLNGKLSNVTITGSIRLVKVNKANMINYRFS